MLFPNAQKWHKGITYVLERMGMKGTIKYSTTTTKKSSKSKEESNWEATLTKPVGVTQHDDSSCGAIACLLLNDIIDETNVLQTISPAEYRQKVVLNYKEMIREFKNDYNN
jgi:glucokinase